MSSPTVLVELFNLSISAGTGIATYARNLCGAAAELGYSVDGLLHSYRPVDMRDPVLAEVSLFDARNRKASAFTRYVTYNLRRGVGLPFGLNARRLERSGVVLTGPTSPLNNIRNAYVSSLFMDLSRFHFKRYGYPAQVNLDYKPDIFHATQAIPIYVKGAKNIYTIHDIVPLRLPHSTLDDKKFFLNMVRRLGQIAHKIVTVSEASRDDLIKYCGIEPQKIVNTYQSVSFPDDILFQTKEEAGRLTQYVFGLKSGDYFLHYGALEPKKNVARLIDAYLASGSRRKLVLAGGLGWEYESDIKKIEGSRTGAMRFDGQRFEPDERIIRLEHLPLFQLTALIRSARAVVFPSLYEGFGLPVLEAMLLETPVITSRIASLAEVAGEAALLVSPTDVQTIQEAIRTIDADDALCHDLIDRGRVQASKFSPAAYKERLGRVYENVLAQPEADPRLK